MEKKRRRKRKGRLRYDRIFLVLFIIGFIIFSINFGSYFKYNSDVYKSVVKSKETTVTINKKYKKIKLFKKTIKYLKENKEYVKIIIKKNSIVIPTKNIENNMVLDIQTYNNRVSFDEFSHSKAFYLSKNDLLTKSSEVTLKLPNNIASNKEVDIYGVINDKYEQIKLQEKVVDNKVTFKLKEEYDYYFITYVKLQKINAKDRYVSKNIPFNLNVSFIPENATNKDLVYKELGNDFITNHDGNLIAKKSGTFRIKLYNEKSNITEEVKITVKSDEVAKKELEKKIEVKNGMTYIDGILIVNKTYSVPKDYNPGKISDDALTAFNKMKEDAANDGIKLWIASGFRSYETQDELYNNYVKESGKEKADTFSARPGHSEHQTGLAMDLNIVNSSFEGTKEAIWIEKNCYKYGFIVRYPKGKESITGYKYEPWHIRYLGEENSKKIYESGLTLEEYFNVTSKYSQ